jgi:hypothetical protein
MAHFYQNMTIYIHTWCGASVGIMNGYRGSNITFSTDCEHRMAEGGGKWKMWSLVPWREVKKSDVNFSEVKWSDVKCSAVKWSEVKMFGGMCVLWWTYSYAVTVLCSMSCCCLIAVCFMSCAVCYVLINCFMLFCFVCFACFASYFVRSVFLYCFSPCTVHSCVLYNCTIVPTAATGWKPNCN